MTNRVPFKYKQVCPGGAPGKKNFMGAKLTAEEGVRAPLPFFNFALGRILRGFGGLGPLGH